MERGGKNDGEVDDRRRINSSGERVMEMTENS